MPAVNMMTSVPVFTVRALNELQPLIYAQPVYRHAAFDSSIQMLPVHSSTMHGAVLRIVRAFAAAITSYFLQPSFFLPSLPVSFRRRRHILCPAATRALPRCPRH